MGKGRGMLLSIDGRLQDGLVSESLYSLWHKLCEEVERTTSDRNMRHSFVHSQYLNDEVLINIRAREFGKCYSSRLV